MNEMHRILSELAPEIQAVKAAFPDNFSGGEPGDDLTLFLKSESTLIRSLLTYVEKLQVYYRKDELDLNLSDIVFEMAGKRREDDIETHDFIYETADEAIIAYLKWLTWAVTLLNNERKDKTSPTAQ